MYGKKIYTFAVAAVCAGIVTAANAALPQWTVKTAYQPPTQAVFNAALPHPNTVSASLILTTVPGDAAEQQRIYAPIAERLSTALGRKVQFRPASDWLTYSREMTAGTYDLVLDDAHFNGWRTEHLQHVPLLSLGERTTFGLVTRIGDDNNQSVDKLSGRRVCTVAAPDLGALVVLAQFSNPMRQPMIVESADTNATYEAFNDGKCAAAILPKQTIEKHQSELRVLYQTPSFPGATLSAGPRIDAAMRSKIVVALTTDLGVKATQALRKYYGSSALVPAQPREYAGLSHWLKDSLYYQ